MLARPLNVFWIVEKLKAEYLVDPQVNFCG